MVAEGVVAPISVKLSLDERRLVEVLPLLGVLIYPQLREHACYDVRHESAEDGVSGILRGGGQNAAIQTLVAGEEL